MSLDRLDPRSLPLSGIPALDAHEAHVWLMPLHDLPVMSVDPQAGRTTRVRQQRMSQRFMLRLLLGGYLGVPGKRVTLESTAAGKPVLGRAFAGSGLHFNLSHAGELLAVAIRRGGPIGIDIEPRERSVRAEPMARRWFSSEEHRLIAQLPEQRARTEFLRRWSAREAVIKAHGGRLARNLCDVVPAADDPARLQRLPTGWPDCSDWKLHEIRGAQEAIGFVATPARLESVRGFRLMLPTAGTG